MFFLSIREVRVVCIRIPPFGLAPTHPGVAGGLVVVAAVELLTVGHTGIKSRWPQPGGVVAGGVMLAIESRWFERAGVCSATEPGLNQNRLTHLYDKTKTVHTLQLQIHRIQSGIV